MVRLAAFLMFAIAMVPGTALAQVPDSSGNTWMVESPLFLPGQEGSFDETAVKDPTIVHDGEAWHLFYTSRGKGAYGIGYASASRLEDFHAATRDLIPNARGKTSPYAAAPQVFYFTPLKKWFLVYQTRDSNYQPVYSTTDTIDDPNSWGDPTDLVAKSEEAKWIDFWVICDETTAYLFYTRLHEDVYVMTTPIEEFPRGFGNPRKVLSPVHEAVHIYKVRSREEYHMLYETRAEDGLRRFGLATAPHLLGPWTKVTNEYASGPQLRHTDPDSKWTEEVSHGELIRTGFDERLEYNPAETRFLIQGMPASEHTGPYPDLPWRLGMIVPK